ncbi:hypothetical protein C1H46_039458 [Malus baccata]|uniref:Uncharacterized protein n=1 Tax=Malus baccata TaxID=106549 RepID=A0A540KLD7_MALBA|nr:hypothetical protein C1H46_039458 [Malus baccata]
MSKTKHLGKRQSGSTVHPCLITLICQRAGVSFHLSDVYPRSTKELDKGLMNLSNVMSIVAHGDPRPPSLPNASQERKIAHLKSELNFIRKQFVLFQSSMG